MSPVSFFFFKVLWYKLGNQTQGLSSPMHNSELELEKDGYEWWGWSCRRRWLLKINGGQVLM